MSKHVISVLVEYKYLVNTKVIRSECKFSIDRIKADLKKNGSN